MQYPIIHKIITRNMVTGLLMVVAVVMTTNSFASKLFHQYSVRQVAEQANPWALPQASGGFMKPQQPPPYRWQSKAQHKQQDGNRFNSQRMGQFVTPGYLESLRQQQMHMQAVPRMQAAPQMRQHRPLMHKRLPATKGFLPQQMWLLPPEHRSSGFPAQGMGNVNPLYNVPAVSPWANSSSLIHRGDPTPDTLSGGFSELSPWMPKMPNEALGGLPPMHIPLLWGGSESGQNVEDKVFNPFTFLPGGRP